MELLFILLGIITTGITWRCINEHIQRYKFYKHYYHRFDYLKVGGNNAISGR